MKILWIIFFILIGCKGSPVPEDGLINQLPGTATFEGYNISGEKTECVPSKETTCTMMYGPDEEFAKECKDRGYEVYTCGCHSFLCEGNIKEEVIEEREGVDFEGNLKSCSPAKSDLICTEVFTQEDAFAVQCEKDGHEAVQCGCHDWICIKGH